MTETSSAAHDYAHYAALIARHQLSAQGVRLPGHHADAAPGGGGPLGLVLGRLNVGVFAVFDVLSIVLVDPDLLVERTRRSADQKAWDKPLVGLAVGLCLCSAW